MSDLDQREYLLMIYFAVAMFYRYEDEVISPQEGEGYAVFIQKNAELIKQVSTEARDRFGYELNDSQIGEAARTYMLPACSLKKPETQNHPFTGDWRVLCGTGGWIESRNWGWSGS